MFSFFSKDNIGSQLIVLMLSISMYVVLVYAYYETVANVGVDSLTATRLWTAVNYNLIAIALFAGLFVVSFVRLTYKANR